ncbi:MAG TPA: preprotein translocase subunit SecE [Dehalococcoidia bacterium]|nr:preprotein translocase subunit SecE [Dehalococcoidia bacterium]
MRRQVTAKGQEKRRFKFVGETISELRKVVWPTRQEATYLTTLVIIATVAVALVLYLIDFGFAELMNVILLR